MDQTTVTNSALSKVTFSDPQEPTKLRYIIGSAVESGDHLVVRLRTGAQFLISIKDVRLVEPCREGFQ